MSQRQQAQDEANLQHISLLQIIINHMNKVTSTSLPDFKWYESVDSFLLELSKLIVSTLAIVKNTYKNKYPGQTLISDQAIEQSVNEALHEKCKAIAANQIKYFTGKVQSKVDSLKKKHEEAINNYTVEFIEKFSI